MTRTFSIYGLIDPRNGELRYVGKMSTNLKHRLASHLAPSNLKPQTLKNGWLKSLMKRNLRPEIFEIERAEPASVDEAERHHIAYFRAVGCRLTNMTAGGDGQCGVICSAERRAKISAAQKGRPHGRMPDWVRQKISLANTGKVMSPESVRKIADANRGSKRGAESLERMRVAKLAEWAKPGHREKMILAHGGRLFVDQHGVEYFGINATARLLDLQAPHIHAVLNGTRKHTGGFVFRYKE